MPKSVFGYRKVRRLTEEQRNKAKLKMIKLNHRRD